VGRWPAHPSVQLGVACLAVADGFAEAVTQQGARQTVALERGLEQEKDEEVAVAQGAARQEQQELQVQPDVPPQAQLEPALPRGPPEQPVLPREPRVQEHEWLPGLEPEARASRPRAQEREEPALAPRVSLQRADVRALQAEQQGLVALAAAQPLLPPLLSRRVPLRRRFRHPRHLADAS
jgi:hypothetical protein